MSGINYPARREIYQIFFPARASRGLPIGGIVHDGAPPPLEIAGRGLGSGTISGRALLHGIAKGGRDCPGSVWHKNSIHTFYPRTTAIGDYQEPGGRDPVCWYLCADRDRDMHCIRGNLRRYP